MLGRPQDAAPVRPACRNLPYRKGYRHTRIVRFSRRWVVIGSSEQVVSAGSGLSRQRAERALSFGGNICNPRSLHGAQNKPRAVAGSRHAWERATAGKHVGPKSWTNQCPRSPRRGESQAWAQQEESLLGAETSADAGLCLCPCLVGAACTVGPEVQRHLEHGVRS